MLTELVFNDYYVRLDHFIFNASWFMLYLVRFSVHVRMLFLSSVHASVRSVRW